MSLWEIQNQTLTEKQTHMPTPPPLHCTENPSICSLRGGARLVANTNEAPPSLNVEEEQNKAEVLPHNTKAKDEN